jgi:hypothetical protein
MRFVYIECQKIRRFWGGKYDFEIFSWRMVAGGDNFGAELKNQQSIYVYTLSQIIFPIHAQVCLAEYNKYGGPCCRFCGVCVIIALDRIRKLL